MTKEEVVEALKICIPGAECENCLLHDKEDCSQELLDETLKLLKENEPAPSANDTSSTNKNITTLDDSTKLEICQEAFIKIGDRIVEVEGDTYILGYVHAVLDILGGKSYVSEN